MAGLLSAYAICLANVRSSSVQACTEVDGAPVWTAVAAVEQTRLHSINSHHRPRCRAAPPPPRCPYTQQKLERKPKMAVSLGHHCKFQRVSRLGSVTARNSSIGRLPNFAALNRGRHLYSAGRPSRWALAHISSSGRCCTWERTHVIPEDQFTASCRY